MIWSSSQCRNKKYRKCQYILHITLNTQHQVLVFFKPRNKTKGLAMLASSVVSCWFPEFGMKNREIDGSIMRWDHTTTLFICFWKAQPSSQFSQIWHFIVLLLATVFPNNWEWTQIMYIYIQKPDWRSLTLVSVGGCEASRR